LNCAQGGVVTETTAFVRNYYLQSKLLFTGEIVIYRPRGRPNTVFRYMAEAGRIKKRGGKERKKDLWFWDTWLRLAE
jgi:hypothetical protein